MKPQDISAERRKIATTWADGLDLEMIKSKHDLELIRELLIEVACFEQPTMPDLSIDIRREGQDEYRIAIKGWNERIDTQRWYDWFLGPARNPRFALLHDTGSIPASMIKVLHYGPAPPDTIRGPPEFTIPHRMRDEPDMTGVTPDDRSIVQDVMYSVVTFSANMPQLETRLVTDKSSVYNLAFFDWTAEINDREWYQRFHAPTRIASTRPVISTFLAPRFSENERDRRSLIVVTIGKTTYSASQRSRNKIKQKVNKRRQSDEGGYYYMP